MFPGVEFLDHMATLFLVFFFLGNFILFSVLAAPFLLGKTRFGFNDTAPNMTAGQPVCTACDPHADGVINHNAVGEMTVCQRRVNSHIAGKSGNVAFGVHVIDDQFVTVTASGIKTVIFSVVQGNNRQRVMMVISDTQTAGKAGTVSVFSLGQTTSVSIAGLKYELEKVLVDIYRII